MTGNLQPLSGLGLLAALEDLADMLIDPLDLHAELTGRYAGGTMTQNDDLLKIIGGGNADAVAAGAASTVASTAS